MKLFFFLWGITKHEDAHWRCHQTVPGGITSPVQFTFNLHLRKSAQSPSISIHNIDSINMNHIDPKHSLTCRVGLTFMGMEGFAPPLMSAGENSSGSAPEFRNSESPLGGSEAGSSWFLISVLNRIEDERVHQRLIQTLWDETKHLLLLLKPIRGLSPAPTSPNISKHQSAVVKEIWTMRTFNPECCH